jgi:hypothetical protein
MLREEPWLLAGEAGKAEHSTRANRLSAPNCCQRADHDFLRLQTAAAISRSGDPTYKQPLISDPRSGSEVR